MAVQVPQFNISGRNVTPSAKGLAAGISGMLGRIREDKQAKAQETERVQNEELFQISFGTRSQAPEDRSQSLLGRAQQARGQGNDELADELERMAGLDAATLDSELVGDISTLGKRLGINTESILRSQQKGAPATGRFRTIDLGDRVQVFDSSTNEVIREVPKGTPEADKIEKDLKAEERREKIEAGQEKKRLALQSRTEATKSLVDQAQGGLDLITEIENHQGFSAAVGAKGVSSLFGILEEPAAGTDAAGVVSLIETLEAKNFLAGIKQFKAGGGAGSLSDAEGKKLGAAVTNLKRSQTEKDFKRNLNTIRGLLKKQKLQASGKLPKSEGNDLSTLSDEEILRQLKGG